jgi:hypothetical protein
MFLEDILHLKTISLQPCHSPLFRSKFSAEVRLARTTLYRAGCSSQSRRTEARGWISAKLKTQAADLGKNSRDRSSQRHEECDRQDTKEMSYLFEHQAAELCTA